MEDARQRNSRRANPNLHCDFSAGSAQGQHPLDFTFVRKARYTSYPHAENGLHEYVSNGFFYGGNGGSRDSVIKFYGSDRSVFGFQPVLKVEE